MAVISEGITNALDGNGDGRVDIQDIIILGLQVPGIQVNRADFLRAEFQKHYTSETIENAIAFTPAYAGISQKDINRIAKGVIAYERNCVSGISAVLGIPGGVAMLASLPADIIQYFGYMLRAMQKLMYLYGFPELDTRKHGQTFDSETLNLLILCLGCMNGVAGANTALRCMARGIATGVERKLLRTALTKGAFYLAVKKVAHWFGAKMTKKVFAGFFKKAIPVVGGLLGGVITFATFGQCCDKLKASLQDTMLSNPNHQPDAEEIALLEDAAQEE